MKRVAVLGSTGSVGESALAVIEASGGRYQAVGLAAGGNCKKLAEQIARHRPQIASVADDTAAIECRELTGGSSTQILSGEDGLTRVASMAEADVVLVAVSGAASLAPTLAAVRAGKTVALASKEAIVMAGGLVMDEARRHGATVLPVDSEHSGIFQALAGRSADQVRRIILPASGGPFLDTDPAALSSITPDQALNHPTWSMGRKITVDSATLMNKALEVIEASFLFGLPADRIDVIIHPQSIVHGIVEFVDGSMVAQMSVPDMRFPILHALAWPERVDVGLPPLDLAKTGSLQFRPLDPGRFPAIGLARRALQMGGTAPAVLAAADEVLVPAFLDRRISFDRIVPTVEQVLAAHEPRPVKKIGDAIAADQWARQEALRLIS